MPLVPRALRPMAYVRRRALRIGFRTNHDLVRLVAFVVTGRPALVRQSAYRDGFAGSSRFWRTVGVGIVLGDVWRKLAVKQPDRVGIERLAPGQGVTVVSIQRSTRRGRRRSAGGS